MSGSFRKPGFLARGTGSCRAPAALFVTTPRFLGDVQVQGFNRRGAAWLSAGFALALVSAARAGEQSTAAPAQTGAAPRQVLSVCADPTNLPYSDQEHPGFENKIAEMLAADMNAELSYTWQRSYRAFLKRTLLAHRCDVVIGVPTALPGLLVTRPYYASSYAAVTRADDKRHFVSFDDDWLRDAKIGVQLIGADHSATPPQSALAVRNIGAHITGFAMRTAGPEINPQGRIIDAVADGAVDVSFVWGPIAGYFAKRHGDKLKLDAVTEDPKTTGITFVYPMSVGVRKDSAALRDRLQAALDRHRADIAAILASYGIPTVTLPETTHAAADDKDIAPAAAVQTVNAQKVDQPPALH
jgi:quinoprotein dehydrogenase-associated probable ABC transporter substrate-binding protein